MSTRKSARRSDLSKTNLDDCPMAKVTGSNPVGCLPYPPSVSLAKDGEKCRAVGKNLVPLNPTLDQFRLPPPDRFRSREAQERSLDLAIADIEDAQPRWRSFGRHTLIRSIFGSSFGC